MSRGVSPMIALTAKGGLGSYLSLAWMLVCVVVIIVLAYLFTKYAAGRGAGLLGAPGGTGNFKVLARLSLGRDQGAVLVKAGGKYLLLGVAPSGVTLLAELTEEEGALWAPAAEPMDRPSVDFRELLRKLREKK